MKVDKRYSWKEKIDPAFDDLIKVHLDYIERTHICSIDKRKRYLSLDDESLKVLEHYGYPPLLKEFKSDLEKLKELMNDAIIMERLWTTKERLMENNEDEDLRNGYNLGTISGKNQHRKSP